MADARPLPTPRLSRSALCTTAVLLLVALAMVPARAEDPREEAVVTLRSGGLSV